MELVFIRHGFSEWNAKNLFTGWRDVNLTERGIEEAKAAVRRISPIMDSSSEKLAFKRTSLRCITRLR